MKNMTSFAATADDVVMNRSMEIVQPTYTQRRDMVHVKYIERRLNLITRREAVTPLTKFQHVKLTFSCPLKLESSYPISSRRSFKKYLDGLSRDYRDYMQCRYRNSRNQRIPGPLSEES